MLEKKLADNKVIRDNIHGNISIEYQIIWDLINTNVLQRLRRIHQLGGTYMVFPCAEHSRFTHSLGVYHIVNRIVNEVSDVHDILTTRDKIIVLCAGLLHDIGHGPFSHAFESVFSTDHEELSIKMISEDSEVNKVLNSYDANIAFEIASVIDKTHPNKLLVQLISSQLDADRMDYLLRDAYNCGVSYGNYDMERILRSMCVDNGILAFKESGVHALEDYIFARYHMYWQVYLHPTANSYEIILTKILKRVKELILEDYQFKTNIDLLMPIAKDEISVQNYLLLDESTLIYYFARFQDEEDSILANLCDCFINRHLFKHLDLKAIKQGEDIISGVEADPLKKEFYFEILIVKNKFYRYYGDINSQSILVKKKTGELVELYEVSDLVSAITNSAKEKEEKKLFYHQNYMEELYE